MADSQAENLHNQIKKDEGSHVGSFVFWFLSVAGLVALDQLVKIFVFKYIPPQGNNYLALTQFKNFNFAFSLPVPVGIMYGIYSVILLTIFLYLSKNYYLLPSPSKWAWALIVAGALSNVGERLLTGSVRDFIYIYHGIFNLADGYIIFGILLLLFQAKKKGL